MIENINPEIAALAVPTRDLVPYPGNARRGNVERIADSLKANGQYRPIVVRRGTNEVLAGNHTLLAAKLLGWEHLAASFVEATDDQARRIVLVDNKANDDAGYDDEALSRLLAEVDTLVGTGYLQEEVDAILASLAEGDLPEQAGPEQPDAGATDAPDVYSMPGDVWLLGAGHKVAFTGDAGEGWIVDAMLRLYQRKTECLPVLERTGESHDFLTGNNGHLE